MCKRCPKGRFTVLLLLLATAASPALAEDVEKKFRFGVILGGINGTDKVESDAANVLTIADEDLLLEDRFVDPRNDSAVFGKLGLNSTQIATVNAQYALTKVFLVEASIGYTKFDLGDVELQAQFDGIDIPDLDDFRFSAFRVPVGELEQVPITVSGIARFRPRATFNPYVGMGIGYSIVGFEPDPQFSALSVAMDSSLGGQATVTSALFGNPDLIGPNPALIGDLDGATVDARDSWTWHALLGAEYSIKRKWSLVLDLRYTESARSVSIGFNGGKDLGKGVPQFTDFVGSPLASQVYGPIQVTAGGLIDGGSLQPEPMTPNADCVADPEECFFDTSMPDGVVDPGFYYAQGGTVDYTNLSAQIGFRYTF